MNKETNYEENMRELEAIVSEIEQAKISIDTLSEKVKRATQLIQLCKTKLYKTEKDISDVLSELDSENTPTP